VFTEQQDTFLDLGQIDHGMTFKKLSTKILVAKEPVSENYQGFKVLRVGPANGAGM